MENKNYTSQSRRRNRQGFRVTGRLGRRYFMQIDAQRIFGRGRRRRKRRRRRRRRRVIIKGGRRGFRIPRGRWMLRVIRKTRRRMRVYVGGARKGSGWFKGKEENVVRLYREDVGDSYPRKGSSS